MAAVDDSVFNPFKDAINTELPRRSALLSVALAGYDGDPNDPGASTILKNAPTGTWYLRETPSRTFYRKLNSGATDWQENGGGGGGGDVVTTEALTFNVDYNDVTATDPGATDIFTTQAAIDDFLAAAGTTNFKHLELVYRAMPTILVHNVTINLAAGVHRPLVGNTSFAWDLRGHLTVGGVLSIKGSTTYDVLVATENVTAVQTDASDPYVDVAGTPFAGLDLRGTYAQFSTNQKTLIHDHTDSRLYLVDPLSPSPAGGTVTVVEPSTKLRNSAADVTSQAGTTLYLGHFGNVATEYEWHDVLIDPFGATSNVVTTVPNTAFRFRRVIIDQLSMVANFGRTPNGNCMVLQAGVSLLAGLGEGMSIRAPRPSGVDYAILLQRGALANLASSYIAGCEDGIDASDAGKVFLNRTVIDRVGDANDGAVVIDNSSTLVLASSTGKAAEIRNCVVPGLFLQGNSVWLPSTTSALRLRFSGNSAACIKLNGNVFAQMSTASAILDGGGNTDVGVEIGGSSNTLLVNATFNLTGTVGDLRIEGIVGSYAGVGTVAAPLITTGLNTIGRG